jgi:hypothetical protein
MGWVGKMCHASGQEKTAYQNQVNTTAAVNSHLNTIFKDNTNMLGNLRSSLQPIIDAGISQYGYTKPQDTAIRTGTADSISGSNESESNAVRSDVAAVGGGNTALASGSKSMIDASLGAGEAENQLANQNAVTQQGFTQGRQNFLDASASLPAATATLEAPTTAASNLAVGAGAAQSSAANSITQANNAWVAPVAGVVGAFGKVAMTAASG